MTCYHPLKGYRSRITNASGKRGIVFNERDGFKDLPVEVPCGQCVGCRLERSRQWAVRCMHEASLYEDNCFLTLTYSDENLPEGGTLVKKHFQDFLKRLRKSIEPHKVRFFHCGEYGENTKRPHYHALLFNYDFPDKVLYSETSNGPLYNSEKLNTLWGHGHCVIGALTFDSAAYVARYVMKKVTGERAESHYRSLDMDTGEVFNIQPEYVTMSRRPGIGSDWYEKYNKEVLDNDFIVVKGHPQRVPKYYDNKLDDERLKAVKRERISKAYTFKDNNTDDRLLIRRVVTEAKLKLKKRNLE